MISNQGLEFIKNWEGVRLSPYLDAIGLPTIGIGHLIKVGEKFNKITLPEALSLLQRDLKRFEEGLRTTLGLALSDLKQSQVDALLSFIFNLGLGNFNKSTLKKRILVKDYQAAANEFLKWNKAGGRVIQGLTNRRKAERKLFLTGQYN